MPPKYRKQRIPGDGLCMYRSIVSALAGKNMKDAEAFAAVDELKRKVHKYICDNDDIFSSTFLLPSSSPSSTPSPAPKPTKMSKADIETAKKGKEAMKASKAKSRQQGIEYVDLSIDQVTYSDYCRNPSIMMSPDFWGGNAELIAAANVLNIRIVLHAPTSPYARLPGNLGSVIIPYIGMYGGTVHLTHDGRHYEWLKPSEASPSNVRTSPPMASPVSSPRSSQQRAPSPRASPQSASPSESPSVSRSPASSFAYKNELYRLAQLYASHLKKKSLTTKTFQKAMEGVYGNSANMAGAYLINRGFPTLAQSSKAQGYAHVLFRAETAVKRKRSASGP